MDSCDSNNVVDDEKMKMNVNHRYSLFLNIVTLFQLIEVLIAFALISWSLSRVISVLNDLNLSGDNLLTFSSNLFNQHVVFIVGNVIIVACYLLSRRTDEGNKSEKYDEKLISSSHQKTTGDGSIEESVTVTPLPEEWKVTETLIEGKPDQEGNYDNGAVITESETAIIDNDAVKLTESETVMKASIGDSVTPLTKTTLGEGKPNQECRYDNVAVKLTESETAALQEKSEVMETTTFGEQKHNQEVSYDDGAVKLTQLETAMEASIGDSVTPSPETTSFGGEKLNQESSYDNGDVKVTELERAMELKVVVKKAVKQIERFRRTESEKLKHEMSVKYSRELQRSVTMGGSRFLVSSGDEMSSEMVEEMSNEEFRLWVESFISKQQSLLKIEEQNCN